MELVQGCYSRKPFGWSVHVGGECQSLSSHEGLVNRLDCILVSNQWAYVSAFNHLKRDHSFCDHLSALLKRPSQPVNIWEGWRDSAYLMGTQSSSQSQNQIRVRPLVSLSSIVVVRCHALDRCTYLYETETQQWSRRSKLTLSSLKTGQ
jgi:hypothetical protein